MSCSGKAWFGREKCVLGYWFENGKYMVHNMLRKVISFQVGVVLKLSIGTTPIVGTTLTNYLR